jgi:hypothetical protein
MLGERGKEKSFLISPHTLKNFRKDTKAQEIIEDYILCRACETRLSFVESYISEEFTNKFRKENYSQNFPVTALGSINYWTLNRVHEKIFDLFIYSLLWRASISNTTLFQEFKLPQRLENEFQRVLDDLLPPRLDYRGIRMKIKDWIRELEKSNLFPKFKYLMLSVENLEEASGDFVFFHPEHKKPFELVLNEWILYFDLSAKENNDNDFFGFLSEYNTEDIQNLTGAKIRIGQVGTNKWLKMKNLLIQKFKEQKLKNLRDYFTKKFFIENNYPPTKKAIDAIILNYLTSLK